MLQGTGATIDELVEATGWQAHSARAAISHILKKKMGLTVISEKVEGRGRVYRVAKSISLRLPADLLDQIKIAANKRDVPYQSLIKVWLAEKVDAD